MTYSGTYNKYETFPDLARNVLSRLFENDEDIWKLLKYSSPDALSKPNLTLAEKRALIYDGLGEQDDFRIFRQPFLEDSFQDAVAQLRIYSTQIVPSDNITGVVDICFEILSHNKIITLDGGQYSRLELIAQRIIQSLNGVEIGGVGLMFFNQRGHYSDRVSMNLYNNRNYVGYKLIMSVHVGADSG